MKKTNEKKSRGRRTHMQICLQICICVSLKTMIHAMNHRFQPSN